MNSDAGNGITVRDYLRLLLTKLWDEQEGFSGKRPFGNSGWAYDLYVPLVREGFLAGKYNAEYDEVDDLDQDAAHSYVLRLIHAAFQPAG